MWWMNRMMDKMSAWGIHSLLTQDVSQIKGLFCFCSPMDLHDPEINQLDPWPSPENVCWALNFFRNFQTNSGLINVFKVQTYM